MPDARDRVLVALDVETLADATALLDRLQGAVTGVKIGSQLFTAAGPAARSAQGRDGIDQRQELGDVAAIRRRQVHHQRDAAGFGQNVMFRPLLAAIGWVRSGFFPPRTARRYALSTTARDRSRSPRRWSAFRSAACRRAHTPARCQRTSRRQT